MYLFFGFSFLAFLFFLMAFPPKADLFLILFFYNKSAERKKVSEWERERERDMLTYQTNDGKRNNSNLVIIF